MEIFCALAGVLFAYTWHPYLPLILALLLLLRCKLSYILCFLVALCWALLHQSFVLPAALRENSQASRIVLQGHVSSKPDVTSHRTRFQFAVNQVNGKKQSFLVQLAWYQKAPVIQIGEDWELVVNLKKPRNLKNPGAFDYEKSLQAKHIAWIGYVRSGSRLSPTPLPWSLKGILLREQWGNKLDTLAPNPVTSGIMQALTLGLTRQIDQENWDLFRRTGTTHLMVISGAHIGLVAGLIFGITNWLWRRSYRCCLVSPAPRIASWFSVLAAFLYACIAGFAVPAQRSVLACGFAFFRFVGNQRFSGWQGWRYGLLFALIFEPHAVLLPGFYLSFTAVAILILIQQRTQAKGWARTMLTAQTACLCGLMPLTLYWFSYASLNGFLANMIAIPLVGFLLVPLSLLTLLIINTSLAGPCMQICDYLIQILMTMLHWIDHFSWINLDYSLNHVSMPLCLMLAMILLVLLPVRTLLFPGCLLCLTVFFPAFSSVKPGQAYIRVLDVGQGLAVVVQTAKHTLLYDAGDAFPGGSDMGKMAILPALKSLGIHALDSIVISHQDKDHSGGLPSVLPLLRGALIVNDPGWYSQGLSCHTTSPWEWDGVIFQFLAIQYPFKEKNNTSCVLKISAGNKQMLLTGDIEKAAEQYLVNTWGEDVRADVLLLAHHGSKTSSSPLFMRHVAPKYAIASTGYGNRYHFPHGNTLDICRRMQIDFYNTAETGMISVLLGENKLVIRGMNRLNVY